MHMQYAILILCHTVANCGIVLIVHLMEFIWIVKQHATKVAMTCVLLARSASSSI